jgi:membrane-associated phospholipid phosphatase
MRRVCWFFCLCLLCPSLSQAQSLPALADGASYGTVATPVIFTTIDAWRSQNQKQAFEREVMSIGIAEGLAFLAKHVIHEQRPCAPACGIDQPNTSFFSAHTALAFSMIADRPALSISLATSTGVLRVVAKKHHWYDVAVGAAVGVLSEQLSQKVIH